MQLPSVSLHEVTPQNVRQLKLINQAVFPVAYDDGFYKRVASSGDLARLAYLGGTAVGGVACQLEDEDGGKKLYITTLGVLPPYRRRGIGKQLVEHVLALCDKDPATKCVSLHVQTNNEAALAFYGNFGFQVAGQMANYYRRIEPPDALVLRKLVNEGQ
ncbi:acetyltransferaseGNAT family protein [Aphelenchoides avenae]|nr:acetyltransferaseGNAT family protein [Aphelenchus avenae]